MSNCFLKRHFCTFSKFVFILFFGLNSYAQTKANLHVVTTDYGIKGWKSVEKELKKKARKAGISIVFDQFTHPLMGKLPKLNYEDKLPYFSTSMRKYRDSFFNNSHKKNFNDVYFFVTKDTAGSFYIPGKNIVFLAVGGREPLGDRLFQLYVASRGRIQGLDTLSIDTLVQRVKELDSLSIFANPTFSFHDDSENLVSSNGLVAFAFWEKNPDGSLKLVPGVHLPFKRNTGKVNLDIDNYWLRPFYITTDRFIAPIHVGLVVLAFFFMLVLRKKVNERADKVLKIRTKLALRILRFFLWILFFVIGYMVFWTTDSLYKRIFFNSTDYSRMGDVNLKKFIAHLTNNNTVLEQEAKMKYWEVYYKENKVWHMKRMKMVLYFKVVVDSLGHQKSIRFDKDAEFIKFNKYRKKSETHLMVYTYFDESGNLLNEKVLNYSGADITESFKVDLPKRILVFVNGYRPVSNGNTLSKAIHGISKFGIEFPDSYNFCYTYDRYNYWGKWAGFDQVFIDRIKPYEVYYADGHHSVETSNYRSLIHFLNVVSKYPKPCEGKHHCEYYERFDRTHKTMDLLAFRSNKRGFDERRRNGRIAGENLLQLLNEVPGNSRNDTLYLVAHSMGFAYAVGMLEVLHRRCQFKSFYILAPENCQAGNVNLAQWKEVYQYGCFAEGPERQAACLQDGVAPQTKVRGLGAKNRLTLPPAYKDRMGFSKSHYLGHYDWIFKIPQGERGAVHQN